MTDRGKIFFLFVFLTCAALKSFAQDTTWPPAEWRDSVYSVRTRGGWASTVNLSGNLLMKNGDTLQHCYLRPWKDYCYVLTLNHVQPVRILYRDILYFQAPLEFRPLYNDHWLWSLIGRKGNVAIYDLSYNLRLNHFGTRMVLKENKKIIKIHHGLLNFINARYHKSFKNDDFKTGMDMIDYVLTEENKFSSK